MMPRKKKEAPVAEAPMAEEEQPVEEPTPVQTEMFTTTVMASGNTRRNF